MSRVVSKGSVRVTAANAFTALTNSGLFTGIANNGVGDNTLSIDADNPQALTARDTIHATAEAVVSVNVVVERLTETTIRVRTFDNAGAALNSAYALVVNSVFEG